MTAFEIIMMILLLVMGVFLVVAMLLQKGDNKLSSTIAGGADNFYDKDKGTQSNRVLSLLTNIVGVVFVIIVLVVYIVQPDYDTAYLPSYWEDVSEYFTSFS